MFMMEFPLVYVHLMAFNIFIIIIYLGLYLIITHIIILYIFECLVLVMSQKVQCCLRDYNI